MFLIAANSDQPPKFNEITPSLVVQPSEQVVIRAEVTLSGTPSVFVSWRHNNATYEDHITEDPICDEAREVRHSNVELSVYMWSVSSAVIEEDYNYTGCAFYKVENVE